MCEGALGALGGGRATNDNELIQEPHAGDAGVEEVLAGESWGAGEDAGMAARIGQTVIVDDFTNVERLGALEQYEKHEGMTILDLRMIPFCEISIIYKDWAWYKRVWAALKAGRKGQWRIRRGC